MHQMNHILLDNNELIFLINGSSNMCDFNMIKNDRIIVSV
jgi:hypothetical protein